MALGVLAYPKISLSDFNDIQTFRKDHDQLYFSIANPHFAFVFPMTSINRKQFIEEVIAKANGVKKIDFEIRCATINKDAFLDYYHVLLVPDKGYSDVVKLHDKLYSEVFFNELIMEIDFIPHIGIANSKNKYEVKKWVDQWNAKQFSISGIIENLTIIDYSNNTLKDVKNIELL